MTRVEKQTMYLDTFLKLIEQATENIPPEDFEVWIGGAASMCVGLAKMDDEITEITYEIILGFFSHICEEV